MSKKTEYLIGISTGLLLIYTVLATLPISFAVIFLLFLATSAFTIWMVITILKDKSNLSNKKFDDFFYEDTAARQVK
jgi:Flp pilus assembly protein TadB